MITNLEEIEELLSECTSGRWQYECGSIKCGPNFLCSGLNNFNGKVITEMKNNIDMLIEELKILRSIAETSNQISSAHLRKGSETSDPILILRDKLKLYENFKELK